MAEEVGKVCQAQTISPWFVADDVIATAEYYRDVLGFTFDRFFGNPPVFAFVNRDKVRIALRQTYPNKRGNSSNTSLVPDTYDTYIWVDDIAALDAELRGRKASIIEGPVDRDYNCREILVRDCNGYMIAFGQDMAPASA